MKKVVLGNDHGAVDLSRRLKAHLESRGYEVCWVGTKTEDSVDYPDLALAATKEFFKGGYEFGILCCGTGIGISMAANKIKGVRCALVHDEFTASKAKEHNDANFISLGGRVEYQVPVEKIVDAFIDTQVSKEVRHLNRLAKMMALENA